MGPGGDLSVKGWNAAQLKLWAIFAMTLDHVAWAFLPSASVPAIIMHILGRTTAPIMCFFVAEGYNHTRNLGRYLTRLGIFAFVSHFAFQYYSFGPFDHPGRDAASHLQTSVIYTLLLGLIALAVWNKSSWQEDVRILIIIALAVLATPGDWMFIGVIFVLIFGRRDWDPQKRERTFIRFTVFVAAAITIASLIGGYDAERFWSSIVQFGILLAVPLLRRYNGERGNGRGFKWLFYLYYPAHLLAIGLLRWH